VPVWVKFELSIRQAGIVPEPVPVVDRSGELVPEAKAVLEVIARHDMVLATGHLSRDEIFTLVDGAAEAGVGTIVVTHPEFPSQRISPEDQVALADKGALMERAFTTPYTGKCTWEQVFDATRAVGAERTVWATDLGPRFALAAPEYCNANFTSYFTDAFWHHPDYPAVFANRSRAPCYFNTGVMVIDLDRWRAGDYTAKLEYWMDVQKQEARIYELGSLPPFLLVFAGDVKAVQHRWNQHGLGGDNVAGQCRELHPGPVSLLHWSGKGKPWLRLDAGRPCPLDALWAPYDLLRRQGARDDLLAAVA
jgi:hypothetical protein